MCGLNVRGAIDTSTVRRFPDRRIVQREEHDAVASGRFGGEERLVGDPQDVVQAGLPGQTQAGDADADRAGHRSRAGIDAEAGHPAAKPFGEDGGAVGIRLGQQDGELLPAVSTEEVVPSQAGQGHGGKGSQDGVADQVAVGIVDPLEIVEVRHQQGEGSPGAAVARDLLLGEIEEGAAVEDLRQGIEGRQPFVLAVGPLPRHEQKPQAAQVDDDEADEEAEGPKRHGSLKGKLFRRAEEDLHAAIKHERGCDGKGGPGQPAGSAFMDRGPTEEEQSDAAELEAVKHSGEGDPLDRGFESEQEQKKADDGGHDEPALPAIVSLELPHRQVQHPKAGRQEGIGHNNRQEIWDDPPGGHEGRPQELDGVPSRPEAHAVAAKTPGVGDEQRRRHDQAADRHDDEDGSGVHESLHGFSYCSNSLQHQFVQIKARSCLG